MSAICRYTIVQCKGQKKLPHGETLPLPTAKGQLIDYPLQRVATCGNHSDLGDPQGVSADQLAERLQRWITRRLVEDYGLRRAQALALVHARRVLPVLDGLDEMDPAPPESTTGTAPRPRARALLRALNASERHPVVVACRQLDYRAISQPVTGPAGGPAILTDARHVTLRPLDRDGLPLTTPGRCRMTALAAASPRPPTPALLVTLLAVAATGCAVAVVALIAAAPGPALLTTAVLALAGWLVRAATTVPTGWLGRKGGWNRGAVKRGSRQGWSSNVAHGALRRSSPKVPEQHGPRSCHDRTMSPKPQVTTRVTSFGTAQVWFLAWRSRYDVTTASRRLTTWTWCSPGCLLTIPSIRRGSMLRGASRLLICAAPAGSPPWRSTARCMRTCIGATDCRRPVTLRSGRCTSSRNDRR